MSMEGPLTELESVVLFLLDVPSTKIRIENGTFLLSVDGNHFENVRMAIINNSDFPARIFLNHKYIITGSRCDFNFPGRSVDRKHFMRFQSGTSVFNLSSVSGEGAWKQDYVTNPRDEMCTYVPQGSWNS